VGNTNGAQEVLCIAALFTHVLPGLQLWILCLFIIMHIHYRIGLILFGSEWDLVDLISYSAVGILTGWIVEVIVFESRQAQEIFIISTPSKPTLSFSSQMSTGTTIPVITVADFHPCPKLRMHVPIPSHLLNIFVVRCLFNPVLRYSAEVEQVSITV
jgi:hypothetical protein